MSAEAWDKELNKIYGLLKQRLSEPDFQKLRSEQRKWIKEKDRKAKEAMEGSESLRAQVEYQYSILESIKTRTLELVNMYFK